MNFFPWIKKHLIATGVIVFAVAAAAPWAVSAVRLTQAGQPVTLESLKKEQRKDYQKDMAKKHGESKELRSMLVDAAGTVWIGTKGGLYSGKEGQFAKVADGPALDVRAIVSDPATGDLYAAGKDGAWRKPAAGTWKMIREGEAHSLTLQGASVHLSTKKEGILTTTDQGATWGAFPGTEMFAAMEPHD